MTIQELEKLKGRLRGMEAVDVAEEFQRVWGGMGEDGYDESLLDAYTQVLDEKAPMPEAPGMGEI